MSIRYSGITNVSSSHCFTDLAYYLPYLSRCLFNQKSIFFTSLNVILRLIDFKRFPTTDLVIKIFALLSYNMSLAFMFYQVLLGRLGWMTENFGHSNKIFAGFGIKGLVDLLPDIHPQEVSTRALTY